MSEKTWIDKEGNVRIWHDENYQMVTSTSVSDVALKMDSWDANLACNMIVFGDGMDHTYSIEYGLTEYPHGTHGNDRAHHSLTVMNRFLELAKAAIAITRLKEHDTPANWITWAASKGYDTKHLNPDARVKALQLAIQDCQDDCPSVRDGYRKQLEQWQQISEYEGLTRQYTMDKKPMPLLGDGFKKVTRLTEYLGMKGEYWTKEEAAYLVNGIDAKTVQHSLYGQAITYAMSFAGERITENTSLYFRRAKEILDVLNRDEMPEKISPIEFVAWCESKVINTDWITNNDEWTDYLAKHNALVNSGADSQDGTEPEGTTKPRMGGYKERDDFAIKLVESRPGLLGMRPGKIKTELQQASNLFTSGYTDWWRNNTIFKKGTPGRNPK